MNLAFGFISNAKDLLHTGAHKVSNTLGQALLAKRMGKTQLIAETGAGQHGVQPPRRRRDLGLKCTVFMGAVDVQRQHHNVMRMELLGARVVPVTSGTQALKDAINDSMRYWTARQGDAFYCFGTAAGPRPYPLAVARISGGHRPRDA